MRMPAVGFRVETKITFRTFAFSIFTVLGFGVLLAPFPARAQDGEGISIERPGDKEFVKDLAKMLKDEDRAKVQKIAADLLKETKSPIIVVTIESMANHGGEGLRIETFALLLFNQWGIGHKDDGNKGMLLLISKKDRRARIELGGGWKRDKDKECIQIMEEHILPHFRKDNYSEGIVAGVQALDRMARVVPVPKKSDPK